MGCCLLVFHGQSHIIAFQTKSFSSQHWALSALQTRCLYGHENLLHTLFSWLTGRSVLCMLALAQPVLQLFDFGFLGFNDVLRHFAQDGIFAIF